MNLEEALKKASTISSMEEAKNTWMTRENMIELQGFLMMWEKEFGVKVDDSVVLASLFIQVGLCLALQDTEPKELVN